MTSNGEHTLRNEFQGSRLGETMNDLQAEYQCTSVDGYRQRGAILYPALSVNDEHHMTRWGRTST